MIRVFEAFSGIGTQRMALKKLGIEHEVVAISEIDKYAIKSYEAIHGKTNNLGDISKVKIEDIPDHDLLTYSFPCQDISIAGKTRGFSKGSGTRSSLLWETNRIIENKKPKYLLMENVKNLISKKFMNDYLSWLEHLESLGYTNYWKVLNAKDYYIPQNRERVFCVSILGEHEPYVFPEKRTLELRLKDILLDKVPEKFYLSQDKVDRLVETIPESKLIDLTKDLQVVGNTSATGYRSHDVFLEEGISPALTATDYKHAKKIAQRKAEIKTINIPTTVEVRAFDVDVEELKKTLKSAKKKSKKTIKKIASNLKVNQSKVEHWFRSDDSFSIPDRDIWVKLKEELNIETNKFDKSILTFIEKEGTFDYSNRFHLTEGLSPTVTTASTPRIILNSDSERETGDLLGIDVHPFSKKLEFRGYPKKDISPCLLATDYKAPKTVIEAGKVQSVGNTNPSGRGMNGNVYNENGLSPTLTTNKGEGIKVIGASRGRNIDNPSDRTPGAPTKQRFEINEKGTSNTLTTVQKDNYVFELLNFQIRKLTPQECWRLMGCSDDDFFKAEAVNSNTQLYKQAGNAIVVNVLEEIFRELFK